MNSLNLRQTDGGNIIKQADSGSMFRFELLDENYKKFEEQLSDTATVILKQGTVAVFKKIVAVTDNCIAFNLDKILEVGDYTLEIIVGDYVFPSNNCLKISVESTYGDYQPENLVRMTYEEIDEKINVLKDRLDDVNVAGQSEMLKRIEILEQKEDHDTIYDDTAIIERIGALEEKPDKDTIYDDSNLKAQISELQEKLKSLNTVRHAPTGYTLDRTTTPWTIWFDNGCGLQMPDYSPRKEQELASTIYGFGYSLNIMNTTVRSYPVPQNFIAVSMGHISLNNFSKQDAGVFNYFSPSMKVINPVRNDAENFDWSHCYGEVNEDNSTYKRKHVFPRVCYELGIWSEADVLYLGATKK